jgi:hypothetical protein
MVAEAQRTEERDAASTSLARRCSDLDLHRIDLTARLLAFKEATLNPESAPPPTPGARTTASSTPCCSSPA